MATPPLRTEISNTYPNPTNAVARAGFGKLYDYVTGLLGATGNAAEARAAIGSVNIAGDNLTGALNDKRSIVALTATTSPIWGAGTGKIIGGTGTPTITDFPAASQAGAERVIYPEAGTVLTHGGNISVQGSANAAAAVGDKWIITAITTTTFYVEVIKKDGLTTAPTVYRPAAVPTTSGTEIAFNSIPSWVIDGVLSLNGVSTNGASPVCVQLGTAAAFEVAGYSGSAAVLQNGSSPLATLLTSAFQVYDTTAASIYNGSFRIHCVSGNVWQVEANLGASQFPLIYTVSGVKTLSDVLTRIRLTTLGGIDTFDAGTASFTGYSG